VEGGLSPVRTSGTALNANLLIPAETRSSHTLYGICYIRAKYGIKKKPASNETAVCAIYDYGTYRNDDQTN